MAVKLEPPRAEDLLTISGVRLGIASAGVRKPGRKDLLVIAIEPDCRVAGVFTQNGYCAAPVLLCREHIAKAEPATLRAVVVNTGVANAGTGEEGLANARAVCAAVGQASGSRRSRSCRFPRASSWSGCRSTASRRASRRASRTSPRTTGDRRPRRS
jgi:glutamate N-acetyltransferase/amino-acid N-acetyltransferase